MGENWVLGVDQGGYCCSTLPAVIGRLRRKKTGDKMWIVMQCQEQYGKFKATLVELMWNADKTEVSARFCGYVFS